MKPASKGTTIIAGSSVRSVLELVGVKDVLTKIIGSSNKINNAKATMIALAEMRFGETIRSVTDENKNQNQQSKKNLKVKNKNEKTK